MAAEHSFADLVELTFPRQHGVWFILAASLVAGTAVGHGPHPASVALAASVLAGILARQAAVVGFSMPPGSPDQLKALELAACYGALSASVGLTLAACCGLWLLIPLGAAGFGLGVATALLARQGRRTALVVDLLGLAGLGLVAMAAEYATAGAFTTRSLGLWLLCTVFFLGRPLHVRCLTRHRAEFGSFSRRLHAGATSLLYQFASLAFIAFAARTGHSGLPRLAPLALAPALLDSIRHVAAGADRKPGVRSVGYAEAAHAGIFVLLTSLAFALA